MTLAIRPGKCDAKIKEYRTALGICMYICDARFGLFFKSPNFAL